MRSCLIREHPCLRFPSRFPSVPPPPFPPSLLLSFSTNGVPTATLASRGCGSLYTRSVAVLNVLSLLMPRSGLPSRSNHQHFCRPPSFSWSDIELYAARIYRSKSYRGGPRETWVIGRRRGRDAGTKLVWGEGRDGGAGG